MNRLFKGLLLTALVASSVNAKTNKTFLMPRSHGVNLPMEYTGFNELVQDKNGDFFGANFQVTPFYMESKNAKDLGKYFGIKNKNLINLAPAALGDFDYRYMIHDNAQADNGAARGTVEFNPKMKAYGARIDYYQDLEKVLDGLYLKIALPIVNVKNDMNIKTAVSVNGGTLTAVNLEDYFKGTYSAALNTADAQAELKNAKRNGSHSETSVADLDVVLGYKVYDKDKYNISLNLGLTVPVGNDAAGYNTFEPMVGNGDHWGLGGGLDINAKLWEDGDQNIKLTAVANYRYLFEGTEKRTLGLIAPNGTQVDWGQYYLAGKIGEVVNTIQLTPVANLLTQDCNVEVGSQLDAMLYLTYNKAGWNFDLGYNFFWKEAEDVNLKNAWTDKVYGIASTTQDMTVNNAADLFDVTNANAANAAGGSIGYINNTANGANLVAPAHPNTNTRAYGIDKTVAESPSQDTHKIFGSAGYIFRDWEYPMLLSLGAHYEFANDDAIENWGINGKVGIKF